jgi:hypothetical protein
LLALLAYAFFLLVLMPLLLLWSGQFAKYCSRRKRIWIGLSSEKLPRNIEADGS